MKTWEVYGWPDFTGRSPLLGEVYGVDKADANEKAREKFGGKFMYVFEIK